MFQGFLEVLIFWPFMLVDIHKWWISLGIVVLGGIIFAVSRNWWAAGIPTGILLILTWLCWLFMQILKSGGN